VCISKRKKKRVMKEYPYTHMKEREKKEEEEERRRNQV